ncbi:hypothetical protein [Roseateles asaccharophilus]|uniref:YqjK-like protein n=1 Tax=Roseateles asaccharophilus TaxID=582607 RepID=A0ABU2AEZ6_9BURK|nr:hypothetical protein [Roseateles asaccharophilus]MDR7335759.1 hypothetical protein [Roseateles asaccharophilus]
MIPRIPDDPRQRAQRKANLLLASELMRGQANLAFDDIGGRADGWVHRLQWIRGVFSQPAVLAAASGGAAFFATAGKQRRGKLLSMLRWGWLAWRLLRQR